MRGLASNPKMRTLAAVLVLFQAILPGTAVVAQASGIDVARVLCFAPGTEYSEAAERYARMLSELLGEEAPADPQPENDCPLSVLAKGKVLAPVFEVAEPLSVSTETRFSLCEPGFIDRRNGPSLGGRAPPAFA